MTTDLTFITNKNNQSLKDRFNVLIKDSRFFDCLVRVFLLWPDSLAGWRMRMKMLSGIRNVCLLLRPGKLYWNKSSTKCWAAPWSKTNSKASNRSVVFPGPTLAGPNSSTWSVGTIENQNMICANGHRMGWRWAPRKNIGAGGRDLVQRRIAGFKRVVE